MFFKLFILSLLKYNLIIVISKRNGYLIFYKLKTFQTINFLVFLTIYLDFYKKLTPVLSISECALNIL